MTLWATDFKAWQCDTIPTYMQRFIKTLQKAQVAASEDGRFIDITEGFILHRNHVKCMIRSEYLGDNPEIKGKKLDIALEAFLDGIFEIIKDKEIRVNGRETTLMCNGEFIS